MPKARFNLFRYQLLPKNRYFQGDLYGPKSIEELIQQKNKLFAEALRLPTAFKNARTELNTQKLYDKDNFFLFRIAVNRSVNLETKDFGSRSVDTWPKLLVAIWNDPNVQLIAIQQRTQAFQQTKAAARLLLSSLEEPLSRHQLTTAVEPLFEKQIFWDLVNKNAGRIKKVEFEIVTPNMASISKSLPEDLKELAKRTNAVKSTLVLEADPESALVLNSNDNTVDGLTAYSSEGGGNVSISLIGVKKKVSTSKTIKEIEIGDAIMEGDPEQIADIIKSLMS